MLWLYLLGIVTVLTIVVRRLRRRLKPLDDELYAKNIAIEHVQTAVAWVRADGKVGSINQAFSRILNTPAGDLVGKDWHELFAEKERQRARDAYERALLTGKESFKVAGSGAGGTFPSLDVMLVAVHDHKMRFIGHYCLAEDRTRERELEELLRQLTARDATEMQELESPTAALRR